MKGYPSVILFGISAVLVPFVECVASTYIQELCTTVYGTKSVNPVPSTTHALTFNFHPTLLTTVIPVRTVTPTATTVIATTFTTSTLVQSVVTDTYSSTSTETDLSTIEVTPLVTVTSTITTTTTLPTPTSTIPTSPGFVPAAAASASFAAKARRDLVHARGAKPAKPTKSCHYNLPRHSVSFYPQAYPTAVICNGLAEVFSTTTITKTATMAATQTASTPIVISTATDTITVTSYPVDASETLTFSTTKTVPTTNINPAVTSTVSTTQTVSYTPPQATYYAACDPATNQVSSVNGYGIDNFAYVGNFNLYGDGNTTPYDCCVACITDPNCGAALDAGGFCELFYPSTTCAGPNAFAGYYYGGQSQNVPAGQGFVVSDGNCGQASPAGLD